MEIDVEQYNRIVRTDEDVALAERCKQLAENQSSYKTFPVGNDIDELDASAPRLTRWGFLHLGQDAAYMQGFYIPICKRLLSTDWTGEELTESSLKALRASLIEFAIMGCMEAQQLQTKLNSLFENDDEFISDIVLRRCLNLKRFLHAHEGSIHGLNEEDNGPSYQRALEEILSGFKKSHWIWYIFPQMYGIKGTHSRPALYYGIRGRREAFEYINHPTLRARLIEVCEAVLNNKNEVYEIFGTDTMKVRACINLFASVSDINVFKKIKGRFGWV